MTEPALWTFTLIAFLANMRGYTDIAQVCVVIGIFLAIVWTIKALDRP